jgi:penicillin-binding protein 2
MSNKDANAHKDNGWFVGFTPRRNPDIVVCVLFEGGEHGKLAARLATQVIKAYEDKKNHKPLDHLKPPPEDGAPAHDEPEEAPPPSPAPAKPTVVTGLWNDGGDSGHLQGARFSSANGPQRKFHRATAAPGMEAFAQSVAPTPVPKPRKKKDTTWRDLPGVVAALPEPVWRMGGDR